MVVMKPTWKTTWAVKAGGRAGGRGRPGGVSTLVEASISRTPRQGATHLGLGQEGVAEVVQGVVQGHGGELGGRGWCFRAEPATSRGESEVTPLARNTQTGPAGCATHPVTEAMDSAAPPFSDQLLAAAALPDQKSKLDKYNSLLATAVSSASGDACKAFVEHCAWTPPAVFPGPVTPPLHRFPDPTALCTQCCRTATPWWCLASCSQRSPTTSGACQRTYSRHAHGPCCRLAHAHACLSGAPTPRSLCRLSRTWRPLPWTSSSPGRCPLRNR
jgi:hypothetical protein